MILLNNTGIIRQAFPTIAIRNHSLKSESLIVYRLPLGVLPYFRMSLLSAISFRYGEILPLS